MIEPIAQTNDPWVPSPPGEETAGVRLLAREAVILLLLLAAPAVSPWLGTAEMAGLVLWATRGSRSALQALTLAGVLMFLNQAIYQAPPLGMALKWLVLFVAFWRVTSSAALSGTSIGAWAPWLGVLLGVDLSASLWSSPEIGLSVFKLVVFGLGAVTVLTAYENDPDRDYWASWFYTLYAVLLGLSLLVLARGLGYTVNARGFQGVLVHPNSYAIIMAPLTVLLTGWLAAGRPVPRYSGWLVMVGWLTLWLSESRTALGASLLAALITLGWALWGRPDWRDDLRARLSGPGLLVAVPVLLLAAIVAGGAVQQAVARFAVKSEDVTGGDFRSRVAQSVQGSRGGIVAASWENFTRHPWLGIGFGIASDPGSQVITRDPVLNLPASAPTEKGFLPTAVLEETGLIGALALVLFLFVLVRPVFLHADPASSWLFWTALFLNFGEMVLFSVGGLGLFLWLMIGLAHMEGRAACT